MVGVASGTTRQSRPLLQCGMAVLLVIAGAGCTSRAPSTAAPVALTFIEQPARTPSPGHPPLLILLHGYGADERDLLSMAGALDPRLAIVSARAPIALENGGYAWFHGDDEGELERARNVVLDFIDRAIDDAAADRDRVYLAGFSQGAMLTAAVALTEPRKLAGAAVISGRLPRGVQQRMASVELLRGFPMLVTHGVEDAIMPIRFGRELRDTVTPLGVTLDYREFIVGHKITDETVHALDQWLQQRLAEKSAPTADGIR